MTAQQRQVISVLLMGLSAIQQNDQIDFIWKTLEAACKQAGIQVGNKPTSVVQAKSVADSIRSRYSI